MRRAIIIVSALLFGALLLYAQEDFTAIHREDVARWAQLTGLSPADIHRMWRSTSHYANEAEDDSSIDLVDVSSLRFRQQILMITSAGLPRCLTVVIFSAQRPAFKKLWEVEQTPDGRGFCDTLDTAAAVEISKFGDIEIRVAIPNNETGRQEVHAYAYKWDGKSYVLDSNVPPAKDAKNSPAVRSKR